MMLVRWGHFGSEQSAGALIIVYSQGNAKPFLRHSFTALALYMGLELHISFFLG